MSEIPPSETPTPPPVAPTPPPFPALRPPEPEEYELPPLLKGLPVPPYVLVLAAITLLAFVFGLFRAPKAVEMGINQERGQRALASGDAWRAVAYFEPVRKAFPGDIDVAIDLADAYDKADRPYDSAVVLDTLEGKEASEEQIARLHEIEGRLTSKLPPDPEEAKKK